MNKEQGIFYPDGSFANRSKVRLKLLKEGVDPSPVPRHLTGPPRSRSFEDWTDILLRRQQERQEAVGIPEYVQIEIDTDKPVCVALLADTHAGGEGINYERIARDVEAIKSIGAYTIAVGDLTDSYFFMPGTDEQLTSNEEGTLYMKSALKYLAEDGHLLAGFGGDHDMWSRDNATSARS